MDMTTIQKEFQQIRIKFTTLLQKYKNAYTKFLEFRDNDTTQTRYFSDQINNIESQLNSILHHLQKVSDNYNKDVHFHTGFLTKQNTTLLSKINTAKSNQTQIKHDDERAKSKQSILSNSDKRLQLRKQQINNYIYSDILLILLILLFILLFSFFYSKL